VKITGLHKYILLITLFLLVAAVLHNSRAGMIFFGDSNISFWRENHYLFKPFIWQDGDYGFFNPLGVINLPIQFVFRILSYFTDIYVLSNLYFYGSILGLFISTLYLAKKIHSKIQPIDCLVVTLFSISNPITAGILLSQTDIAISFIFVNLFVAHLFVCMKRDRFFFKDLVVFSVLTLFINTYFFNTLLLFFVVAIYFLFFNSCFIRKNYKGIVVYFIFMVLVNGFSVIAPPWKILTSKSQLVTFYSKEAADGVLMASSNQIRSFSPFMFSNSYITNPANSASFFSNPFIVISGFALLLICFYFLLIKNKSIDKDDKKYINFFVTVFLIFYVLSLGSRNPFGNLFMYLWNYIPGFNVFRSTFKFQFVINTSFTILLVYSLKYITSKWVKATMFIGVIILTSSYFLNPYFVRLTKPYKIPDYYFVNEKAEENSKLVGSYKILPVTYAGSPFLYTAFDWNPNEFDSANILRFFLPMASVFTPFSAPSVDKPLENELCNKDSTWAVNQEFVNRLLGILNIKKIIIQNDLRYKEGLCKTKVNFLDKHSVGALDLYSADPAYFLQHIYSPREIVYTESTLDHLQWVLESAQATASSYYFKFQNAENEIIKSSIKVENLATVVEFKKINQTKYRVIVHNSPKIFPIILSDSYDSGWKVYLSRNGITSAKVFSGSYPVIDSSDNDQASPLELAEMVEANEVNIYTVQPGNNSIKFVSKKLQGVIQNDNLKSGTIFETWNKKPVGDNDHFVANGYSNGWLMNISDICSKNLECTVNSDTSYDFELIIEFQPQQLFYGGFILSVFTLGLSLIYILTRKHTK